MPSKPIPVSVTDAEIEKLRSDAASKNKTLAEHVRKSLKLPPPRREGRPSKPTP